MSLPLRVAVVGTDSIETKVLSSTQFQNNSIMDFGEQRQHVEQSQVVEVTVGATP